MDKEKHNRKYIIDQIVFGLAIIMFWTLYYFLG